MISSRVSKQHTTKASWRNKMESNPEFSERKAKEVSQGGVTGLELILILSD